MRWSLSVIVVVLLAAVVWLIGHDSTANVIIEDVPDTIVEQEEKAAEPKQVTSEPKVTEEVKAQPEEATARKAVTASSADFLGEITVVRDADDQPIEGAEVGLLLDYPDYQTLSKEDLELNRQGSIEFFRKFGLVLKTDSKGKCKVPLKEHGISVTVTFEDLVGSCYLTAKQLSGTARLKLDHKLLVHVLNAAGRSAEGVKIIAKRENSKNPQVWHLGTTDAEGLYTHHHTQSLLGDEGGRGITFHAAGIGVESESVEVDLLSARVVHVTLSMPRTGTITFELLDEIGGPFDLTGYEQAKISMTTHDSEPSRRDSFMSINSGSHEFGTDGRVLVRYVALDKFYAAHLSKLVQDPLNGRGPTTATPDIVVPIVIDSDAVIFTGRVVDPEGEAIAGKNLYLIFKYGRGMAGQTTTTADNGEFVLPMPHLEAGNTVELSGLIRTGREPNLSYRHREPWNVTKGKNELGEITFAESPVLLTGKLVVPAALEETQRLGWQIETWKDKRWHQDFYLETLWHAERRFEVRGEVEQGTRLRLMFQQGDHLPLDPLEFEAGTKDIEIALASAGSVTATMLLDDMSQRSVLRVTLESDSPVDENDPRQRMARLMGHSHRLQPLGKGRLQRKWPGLESGRYELRIECSGASEPLVIVSGIQVGSGEVDDPRLKDIDLRGRLRQVEISLIDEQGQVFTEDNTVVYLANAGGTEWNGFRPQHGKVKVTITDAARIRVTAREHTLVFADGVSQSQEIIMKRAPAVRFVVKWPFPLPEGMTAKIKLQPSIPGTTRKTRARIGGSSGGIANSVLSQGTVDGDGNATVHPMVMGKQKVSIELSSDGRRRYMLYPKTNRNIEVTGLETEAIEISVSSKTLQSRLDRMKKR